LWGCVLAIAGNPLFETDWQWAFLRRHRESLAVLGLIVIVGTIGFRNEYFRETARYTLQSLALYPILFYCVQKRGGFISRFLEWRPLREIGHLSYAMYLIHWLILLALPRYVPLGMVGNAVAGFALSVLYAVAMRSLVENPLRRLVH
jgi:peptidoglycan/LPS O-acetylase OafA/YrhL